jgi:hypothetical protein
MCGVRTTVLSRSEGGMETASIWPFLGATLRRAKGDVLADQEPVQSTNCAAWRMPAEV